MWRGRLFPTIVECDQPMANCKSALPKIWASLESPSRHQDSLLFPGYNLSYENMI